MIKKISLLLTLLFISTQCFATTLSQTSMGDVPRQTFNMIFLGDSITFGANSSDAFGYRKQLQNLLGVYSHTIYGTFQDPTSVSIFSELHSGISGQVISQISSRVAANLAFLNSSSNFKSRQMFLIHAGTNDVTSGCCGPNITSTVNQYTAMLDIIMAYNPTIEIYCALLIPRNDARESENNALNSALNTALQTYQGSHPTVHIVDMNAAFLADASWATDYMGGGTIHPISAGYVVMAQTWANCINNHAATYCDGH